jgi:hypothetical protein
MNIMELGAIGELVGGVAVIASLIYVGSQVRQGNRIATTSAAQRFREINDGILRQLFADPNLTKLYLAGLMGRNALPTEERLRFDMILMSIFRGFESQVLEHRDGYLSAEILESYGRTFAPIMRQPGALTSWRRQKEQLTARFQNYVDQNFIPSSSQEA